MSKTKQYLHYLTEQQQYDAVATYLINQWNLLDEDDQWEAEQAIADIYEEDAK